MKQIFIFLLVPLVLSSCSLSLSPEKAATITVSPQEMQQSVDEPSQASPTPDPLDETDLTDQQLLDALDEIENLDLNSDIQELDDQLAQ